MNDFIRTAFERTCQGYSPDRVVTDPELNHAFTAHCRLIGVTDEPAILNWQLLNLRKRGQLRNLRSRRAIPIDDDAYRFAAEIAVRFLERRDGLALDRVITDPDLARQFDEIASQIAPGFSSFQYRWSALNLRKKSKLKPELLSRLIQSAAVTVQPVNQVNIAEVPALSGIYIFYTADETLYVGEAQNLNQRIRKHLDHSDNRWLARYFWENGTSNVHLELHTLPSSVTTRVRRALETEMIRSRRSAYNVQR